MKLLNLLSLPALIEEPHQEYLKPLKDPWNLIQNPKTLRISLQITEWISF